MTVSFGTGDSAALGVPGLLRGFADGSVDPLRTTEECLQRIAAMDAEINAFVWVDADNALVTAALRSRQLRDGITVGPLHGLPIAVKELVDVAGAPSEYSSQARTGSKATKDAVVVGLLRRAGAVIIGTTRSHEFGWGITTQHAVRGGTRNPAAPGRVPGGSSGGAAAAVATGMVPVCVATDTGGSIRIPSAFCGVAGVKPSFGSVPVAGVVPLAPSLDTVGVIARHVEDLGAVLRVMQSVDTDEGSPIAMFAGLAGLSIAVAPQLVGPFADVARLARYDAVLAACVGSGVRISEVVTPSAQDFRRVFAVIQGFEAFRTHTTTLGLYPRRRSDYGLDVSGRLDLASTITEGEYAAARRTAEVLSGELIDAVQGVDALLTPVALVPPPLLDSPDTVSIDGVSTATRDAVMGFTVPQNVAGLPTVTIPAGHAGDGLPFGVQVTCAPGMDAVALGVGALLEQILNAPLGAESRPVV